MHKRHADYYTKGERARAHTEYKKVLNRKSRMHTKVFHERIRSLRSSDPRAYWKILNSNNRQKKHTVGAISHDLFVEHFENFFMHLITKLTYLYTMIWKMIFQRMKF